MTPQSKVQIALARLARMSPRWRTAIPLVQVKVTKRARTATTVGNEVRINPQFVARLSDDETASVLAETMGGVRAIRDILKEEQTA